LNPKNHVINIMSINGNYLTTFHSSAESLQKSIQSYPDTYFLIDTSVLALNLPIFSSIPENRIFPIQSEEDSKSLIVVEAISKWLIKNGAIKSSLLIGIGGGVVQDLATFVSHIYYRGISWRFVPTTLLSQADSCIGAKCALNIEGHKNQIGVIHTPMAVDIYPSFLKSLPLSEIQSGYGEIAKLAVTGSRHFLDQLEAHLEEHGMSLTNIETLIEMSLLAKKEIIELDEYESDLRRTLNYGHSFGHALESLMKGRIVHGDAVVVGMELINFLGMTWGITELNLKNRMDMLFYKYFSHIRILEQIDATMWVEELRTDKKMKNGKMNFAVPTKLGVIKIVEKDLDLELVKLVGEFINGSSRFHTS
jgi:3-dehydroquinate synthase